MMEDIKTARSRSDAARAELDYARGESDRATQLLVAALILACLVISVAIIYYPVF